MVLKGSKDRYEAKPVTAEKPTALFVAAHFPDEKRVNIHDGKGKVYGKLSPSIALAMVRAYNAARRAETPWYDRGL